MLYPRIPEVVHGVKSALEIISESRRNEFICMEEGGGGFRQTIPYFSFNILTILPN